MMNKIVNWTFGSFFRTLGRFAFYILIGFLLSYLLNGIKLPKINILQLLDVYAVENPYTLYTFDEGDTTLQNEYIISNTQFYASSGYNAFNRLSAYNCTSSSSCTGSITMYNTTGGNVFQHTMQNYGYDFAHDLNNMISSNHLISYQYIACYENSVSNITNAVYVNTGLGSGRNTAVSLLKNDYYSISNIDWTDFIIGFVSYNCYTNYMLFVSPTNSNTIKINVRTSQYSQKHINLIGYKIDDLGPTDYLTSSQLNSAISNSGLATASSVNNVQQSVNQVQQEIDGVNDSIQEQIDADAQNTQDIIDSQSANTQAQIDSQKVCTTKQFDSTYGKDTGTLKNDGTLNTTCNGCSNFKTSDYIEVSSNSKIKRTATTYPQPICFYDSNKTYISCISNNTNVEYSMPNNTKYVRFVYYANNTPTYEITNICINGNQAMQDTLTDSSAPTNLDSLNNSAGWLPAGPVDGILNLPLSFLTNLNTNLSKSCEPVNLPLPYINQNLPLPCINSLYSQINGLSTWINTIGIIASAFILFGYFINLYKYIDDTLTFRENNYIDNWSGV